MPAFVYVTDAETFARIASGDLHALTAMAQARVSDPVPMQLETANGFEMDDAGRAAFLSVSFHFFTMGQPEIVPLGTARARLGGRQMALEDNQAIFVPAGMTHEFWNPGEERATLILIMFGENA